MKSSKLTQKQESEFYYSHSSSEYAPKVSPHFHTGYELLLLQKGDVGYIVESNQYDMSVGDLMITNPRELHYPVFHTRAPYERSLIFLKPTYLSEFVSGTYDPFTALEKRKIGTQNRIPVEVVQEYSIDKKINLIGELFASDAPEREVLIKSHLIQLLVALNRVVITELSGFRSNKMEDIIAYINKNLTESLTLEHLSEHFYLSKFHISHMFKERTGFSFTEYLICKRVMLAKELILNGMQLGQACDETGFGDYSGFYRAFKKVLGISPSDLKK